MTFDPTQPFEIEQPSKTGSGFDPSQPFEVEKPPTGYVGEQDPGYTSSPMLPFRYRADPQGNAVPGSVEFDPMRSGLSGSIFRGLHDVDVHATGQAADVYNPRINPDTLGLLGFGASPEIWTRPNLTRPIPLNPGDLSQRQIGGPTAPPPAAPSPAAAAPAPPPAPAGPPLGNPTNPIPGMAIDPVTGRPVQVPTGAASPAAPSTGGGTPTTIAPQTIGPPGTAPAPMTPGTSFSDPFAELLGKPSTLTPERLAKNPTPSMMPGQNPVAGAYPPEPAGTPPAAVPPLAPPAAAPPPPDGAASVAAPGDVPTPAPMTPGAALQPPPQPPPVRDPTVTPAIQTLAGLLADPRPAHVIAAETAAEEKAYQDQRVAEYRATLPQGWTLDQAANGAYAVHDPLGVFIPVSSGFPTAQQFSDVLGQVQRMEQDNAAQYAAIRRQGTGTAASPVVPQNPTDIPATAANLNPKPPTPGQAAAGNYQHVHAKVGGLDVAIETPAGGTRSGVGPDGKPWSVTMLVDYGRIKKTRGADGDQLDIYLGPLAHEAEKHPVFIIDQRDTAVPWAFDEHKIMAGFPTREAAEHAYRAAFSDGQGGQRIGGVFETSWPSFRAWQQRGNHTKPLSYRSPGEIVTDFAKQHGLTDLTEHELTLASVLVNAGRSPLEAIQSVLDDLIHDYLDRAHDLLAAEQEKLDKRIEAYIKAVDRAAAAAGVPLTRTTQEMVHAYRWKQRAVAADSQPPTGPAGVNAGGGQPAGGPAGPAQPGQPTGGTGPAGQGGNAGPGRPPETRPAEGAGAQGGQPSGVTTLAEDFANEFRNGRSFSSIVQARQFAATKLGGAVQPGTPQAKVVDEAIELGVIIRAREIAQGGGSKNQVYDDLVKLYGQQPTLGTRTSDSVERQAYSTPVPLAFIASHLAGITTSSIVYEPTAGNGALLIGADPKHTIANEIDPDRRAALEAQGLKPTGHDASTWRPNSGGGRPADAVIANPPFGAVRGPDGTSKVFDLSSVQPGYKTHEIDHAIAFKALEAMADDGRTVLILGGLNKQIQTPEGRRKAYGDSKAKREFFQVLYEKYNVVDAFTVAGELYAKQGAGWPVDVIVIEGRGKSKLPKPMVEAPRVLDTWEAIGGLLAAGSGLAAPAVEGKPAPGVGGAGAPDSNVGPAVSPGPGSGPNVGGNLPGTTGQPSGVDAGTGGGTPSGSVGAGPGATGAGAPAAGPAGVRGPRGTGARPGGRKPGAAATPGTGGVPGSGGRPAPDQPATVPGSSGSDQGNVVPGVDGGSPAGPPKPGVAPPLSEDELGDMFDDIMGGAPAPKPTPPPSTGPVPPAPGEQPPPPAPLPDEPPAPAPKGPTAKELLAGFQRPKGDPRNLLRDADPENDKPPPKKRGAGGREGLTNLFGPGKPKFSLAPQPAGATAQELDPDTWRQAMPMFHDAVQEFRKPGDDIRATMQALIGALRGENGWTDEMLRSARPYIVRFVAGVQAGTIDLDKPLPPEEGVAGDESGLQVDYVPQSKQRSVDTKSPVNQVSATKAALVDLEALFKAPIDVVVAKALGYDPATIGKYFSAEQIDAIGLGIQQIDRGRGLIIGDQTGVGKGRFVAALIRYAEIKGLVPIFVTEKPALYADMVRDLRNIGMPDFPDAIQITNSNETVPYDDKDPDLALRGTPASSGKAIAHMIQHGALPKGKRALFTTYNQLQEVGTGTTDRQRAVFALAPNAFLILDESHNAGGVEQKRKPKKKKTGKQKVERSVTFRRLVSEVKSVAFSSATFAKRPDVLSLYAQRTDLRDAADKPEDLAKAIVAGGVPMQQIITAKLARVGQYIRREKSFAGIAYDAVRVPVDRKGYEDLAVNMHDINQWYENQVKEVAAAVKEVIQQDGATKGVDGSIGYPSVTSTGFGSVQHNLIDQLLLASKAPAVVEGVLEQLAQGNVATITVKNTMGSFIEDYAEEHGVPPGGAVDLTFNDLARRYLDRNLRISVKPAFADDDTKPVRYVMNIDTGAVELDLGKGRRGAPLDMPGEIGVAIRALKATHTRIADQLKALDLDKYPVSPIDFIMSKIRDAGHNIGEITGRSYALDYSKDGKSTLKIRGGKEKDTTARRAAINGFNDGTIDVLIFNESAASGVSLHSSVDNAPAGQKPRVQFTAQPAGNIDTQMQLFGRVNRVGQVNLPRYIHLIADVPAENRPAALLQKKMASLNAATSSSRRGNLHSDDVPDFMNKYGGLVLERILEGNPDWNDALDDPLLNERQHSALTPSEAEEFARKVSGSIPLVPWLDMQEAIYAEWDARYRERIKELDEAGENDLEAKTLQLDAKPIEEQPLTQAKPGATPDGFGAASVLQKMDVKRTILAPPPWRILGDIVRGLDDETIDIDANDHRGSDSETIAALIKELSSTYENELDHLGKNLEAVSDAAVAKVDAILAAAKPDGKPVEPQIAQVEAQRERLKAVLRTLIPGTTVSSDGGVRDAFTGVITSVHLRGRNALVPSAWDVHMISEAGARKSFSLARLATPETAPTDASSASYDIVRPLGSLSLGDFLDAMIEASTEGREERWIVTGNVLAGYAAMKSGQIINFTDDKGGIHQGIIMPQAFDPAAFQAGRAPVFPLPAAVGFLRDQVVSLPFIETSDGRAKIARNDQGDYRISVPRSRAHGSAYFLDAGLRRTAGDFVSSGDRMAVTFKAHQLPAVMQAFVQVLAGQGGVQITSTHPDARKWLEDHPRFFLDDAEAPPKSTPDEAPDPKAIAAALAAARTMTGGKVSAQIGRLPEAAKGVTIGRVIRVALSTEVPRVIRHETIHALRNMGVINPREWATLEAAARREKWVEKHGVDARYRNLTDEEQIEEAVGEQFATWEMAEAPKGALARAFNVVNTFFDKARNKLAQRGFQTAEDVFGRVETGKVGARRPGSEGPTRGPTTIADSQDLIDRFYGHTVHNYPVVDDEGREFNLADVDDRDGMPRYSLKPAAGGGFLVGTTRGPTPIEDLIRRSPRLGDDVANKVAYFADTAHTVQQIIAPMTGGTVDARADAKIAANDWRDQRWTGNRIVRKILAEHTPERRKAMYQAVDAERVAANFGQPMPITHGIVTLPPAEQQLVRDLIAAAEVSWARARRVGIHDKDGQDFYVPAMVLEHGGPLAHVVEDIATLALATMKLNEAIVGKELINRIKAAGARVGHPTVGYGLGPSGPGFSYEPSIGITTTTPNVKARKHDTVEETEAAAALGQPMPDGWFTRPENAAFYHLRYRGTDRQTGKPIFDKVPIWIHPDYKAPINAILRREYSARFIYKGLMSLKSRMMQTIMFGVSHLAVIAGRALPAASGNPIKLYRMAKEGYASKDDPVVMRRFIQAGMVPIGRHFGQTDVQGIEDAPQLKPGRSWTANILAFVPGLVSDRAGTAVKKAVDAAGWFAHEFLLWDRVQDIQVGVAIGLERRLMAQGLDPRSATAIAAHFSNRYAGSLPREAMSQEVEELANTILFSRSYRLGGLGMIKDAIKGLPKDVQAVILRQSGAPALRRANTAARRLAVATLAIDLGLLAAMYSVGQSAFNVALDAYAGSEVGKAISREAMGYVRRFVHEYQNFPTEANPLNILRNLTPMGAMNEAGGHEPGKEARLLVGYQDDGTALYMRVPAGKYAEDVVDYLSHPYDTAHTVLSPFARIALGLWTNDAGFGRKIANPNFHGFGETAEAAGDIAAWSVGQMGPSIAIGAAKNLVTGKGGWMDAAKIAGAATGFSFSQGHPGGPMEGLQGKIQEAEKFKADRAMPAIREAIKAKDIPLATKLMREAGIKDPRYQRYIIMHTQHPNMTPRQLQRLTGSATPEQMQQLQGAREFQRERPRPAP